MTEYKGTLRWFGHAYDTPMYEGMPEVPAPIGANCTLCGEEIVDGDDGVTLPHGDAAGTWGCLPQHIECHIRSILGGVAHMEGRCSCVGGNAPETGMTYREEAKEVFERWGMPNRMITQ